MFVSFFARSTAFELWLMSVCELRLWLDEVKRVQSVINDVCFGHKLMKKNNLYHEFANPAVEKYYITVNFTVI